MISIDDLKKIPLLQNIPDAALEKLLPIATTKTLQQGEVVCEEPNQNNDLYIVQFGKVVIQAQVNDTTCVALEAIKAGELFGRYGALPTSIKLSKVQAEETTDLIIINGESLHKIMNEDANVGFLLMAKLYQLMILRADKRTKQLLGVLQHHPALASAD